MCCVTLIEPLATPLADSPHPLELSMQRQCQPQTTWRLSRPTDCGASLMHVADVRQLDKQGSVYPIRIKE